MNLFILLSKQMHLLYINVPFSFSHYLKIYHFISSAQLTYKEAIHFSFVLGFPPHRGYWKKKEVKCNLTKFTKKFTQTLTIYVIMGANEFAKGKEGKLTSSNY